MPTLVLGDVVGFTVFLCAVVYATATPVLKHFGAVRGVTVEKICGSTSNSERCFSKTRNVDIAIGKQRVDDVPRERIGIPLAVGWASGIGAGGIHQLTRIYKGDIGNNAIVAVIRTECACKFTFQIASHVA